MKHRDPKNSQKDFSELIADNFYKWPQSCRLKVSFSVKKGVRLQKRTLFRKNQVKK